jgi:hypothetical protein
MGTGVRVVVNKSENYVRYIDTARISKIKANIRNCKWYYKMQPGNNRKETGWHVEPDVHVKNDIKLYIKKERRVSAQTPVNAYRNTVLSCLFL